MKGIYLLRLPDSEIQIRAETEARLRLTAEAPWFEQQVLRQQQRYDP